MLKQALAEMLWSLFANLRLTKFKQDNQLSLIAWLMPEA
jgi:hypothetical protein